MILHITNGIVMTALQNIKLYSLETVFWITWALEGEGKIKNTLYEVINHINMPFQPVNFAN
jgi:hypothetical protein